MNANYDNYTEVAHHSVLEYSPARTASKQSTFRVLIWVAVRSFPESYINSINDEIYAAQINLIMDQTHMNNSGAGSSRQKIDSSQTNNLDSVENSVTQPVPKSKRACDSCSIRKVKCDLRVPCSRCITHGLECTNIRVKKKCGPKKIHDKTRDAIKNWLLLVLWRVTSLCP